MPPKKRAYEKILELHPWLMDIDDACLYTIARQAAVARERAVENATPFFRSDPKLRGTFRSGEDAFRALRRNRGLGPEAWENAIYAVRVFTEVSAVAYRKMRKEVFSPVRRRFLGRKRA